MPFSSESFCWIWNDGPVQDVLSYEILLIWPQTRIFTSCFHNTLFFGTLPNLKSQEMGVSKIWLSFLWKEGREHILPIFFFFSQAERSLLISLLLLYNSVIFQPSPMDTHLGPLCISNLRIMKAWECLFLHHGWTHCDSLAVWQCFQCPAKRNHEPVSLLYRWENTA